MNNTQQAPSMSPTQEQLATIHALALKMAELGIEAEFVAPLTVGPIITCYRFKPEKATRVSHIEGLASDFAVALGVEDVLVKRMPGESAVGIFVPNKQRTPVDFKKTMNWVWQAMALAKSQNKDVIPLNFGMSEDGQPFVDDLTSLPHLLISGSTNSGKSTLLHSIIGSIVYCLNSQTVQLVLSDTKTVEFGHFIGLPHLLFPPATSVYQTLEQLDWVIDEMERRLLVIGKSGHRNIKDYNNTKEVLIQNFDATNVERMPYIVVVIDEVADLMAYKGKKRGEGKIAEEKLSAIVQKSRAAGVYVIAATQRPSVNVVAGSIKANFPARLTFRLPSETDSRTVIGTGGAEHLLSQGDMLYLSPNKAGLVRLHAPYASIEDIKACVEAVSLRERS